MRERDECPSAANLDLAQEKSRCLCRVMSCLELRESAIEHMIELQRSH